MHVCCLRVICVSYAFRIHVQFMLFFLRVASHACVSVIDMQVHAHAIFAHAATRTRGFYTRDGTHMQFTNIHECSLTYVYVSAHSLQTEPYLISTPDIVYR